MEHITTPAVFPAHRPIRVGFLQTPGYSGISFASALEPLRMANYLTGSVLCEWVIITVDGNPVPASSGLTMSPNMSIATVGPLDMVLVCAGIEVRDHCDQRVLSWLRILARQKTVLGSVNTGTYVLLQAGVLHGYRYTIHWENIPSATEELRLHDALFAQELFVIDRDRATCSGGIAPIDMMINLLGRQFGTDLASRISEELLLERLRDMSDIQRIPLRARVGMNHPRLVAAASLMEANIEEPLSLSVLADRVGVTCRQLERMFSKHLRCGPRRYYIRLRLSRARHLLAQTNMSIIEVATACGFSSPSHFSACYRELYGRSPTLDRRQWTLQQSESSAATGLCPLTWCN